MLKRILTLVDDTPASKVARGLSRELAAHFSAGLTGIGGADVPFVMHEDPLPIGALGKRPSIDPVVMRARERRERLRAAYVAECAACGRPARWLDVEGDPTACLVAAAATHDLIVTGHDSTLHGEMESGIGDVPAHLLKITPRPVIVCPDRTPRHMPAMVAFDGSMAATRSLQLATLLGLLGTKRRIVVVTVADSETAAARIARQAGEYLRAHGLEAEEQVVVTASHPAPAIRTLVEARTPGLLVIGAYGARGQQQVLFGSTTRRLIEDPPCPVFLYH